MQFFAPKFLIADIFITITGHSGHFDSNYFRPNVLKKGNQHFHIFAPNFAPFWAKYEQFLLIKIPHKRIKKEPFEALLLNGAGDEARTRDILLGKCSPAKFDVFDEFYSTPQTLAMID